MALPSMAMLAQYYISCVAYLLALPTGILSGVTEPLELRENRNLPCENTLSQLTFHTPSTGRTGKFTLLYWQWWLSGLDAGVSGKNLLVPTSPIKAALSFIRSTISSLANNLITKLVNFMQTILLVCEGVWSSSLEEHWWSQRLCRHTRNNHLYPRMRTCTKA